MTSISSYSRWNPLGSPETYTGPTLRKWQQQALAAWDNANRSGVVEAITGTGKSLVGLAAIHEVVSVGGVAIVVVPTRALVGQWAKEIREKLPRMRVGLLSDGEKADFYRNDVIVGTVQSVYKNPPGGRSLMLVVADEVHRYGSSEYKKALAADYHWRLGLTGTYERQNDDGIEKYLDPYFAQVVFTYGYGEALDDRVVAPFDLGLVSTPFTEREQTQYSAADERCSNAKWRLTSLYNFPDEWQEFFRTVTLAAGSSEPSEVRELAQKYMSSFSERKRILASTESKLAFLENTAALLEPLNGTLVFSESKDSSRRIAYVMNKSVRAFPLDGDSSAEERNRRLREFSTGALKVICAPRILDEGIDVPEAELAIVASASQSKRQMIQRMGRVIRLKDDGRHARIMMLYVPGTPEDPSTGGHEAFLNEVIPHSRSQTSFSLADYEKLHTWLRVTSP